MSVEVQLTGGLGNRMLQYALARRIAEHLGLGLRSVGRGLPGIIESTGMSSGQNEGWSSFREAPLRLKGKMAHTPAQVFDVTHDRGWTGQIIDVDAILADDTPRAIRLHGYFERYEYVRPILSQMREWFEPQWTPVCPDVGVNDVAVTVRRDALAARMGWVLPNSFYIGILDGLAPLGRVYICPTEDDLDEDFTRALAKYSPVYFGGSAFARLAFLRRFKRIILTNSVLAWWAGLLGAANEVYAPRNVGRVWAFTGFGKVDLNFQDSRYREVPVGSSSRRTRILVSEANDAVVLATRGRPLIAQPGCQTVQVPVSGVTAGKLLWLLRRTTPVSMSEIADRFGDAISGPLTQWLLAEGLLAIRDKYVDEDGTDHP